jgi:invasion protein IalB
MPYRLTGGGCRATVRLLRLCATASALLFSLAWVPASAATASTATRTEKTFGSWTVVCTEDGKTKRCTMGQSRAQVEGNKKAVVLVWSISSSHAGDVTQSVLVPAGISVKEGVRVFIGDGDPITIPYDACGPRVCIASAPLDQKQIATIKLAKKASASYVRGGTKQLLQVDLDLGGFADAYEFLAQQMS